MKVLVDSSVWADFFNGYDSPETDALAGLLAGDDDICTCGVVVAEVLQGLRRAATYEPIRAGFEDLTLLEPSGLALYVRAAEIYRELRKRGVTVRSAIDCLVAVIAEANQCFLLHRDSDLRQIADSGAVDLRAWPKL